MKFLYFKHNNLDFYTLVSLSVLISSNKLTKEYKDSYKVSIEQRESLIGLILGDLSIEKSKHSKNARLRLEQSIIHKEYIISLYDLFEPLVNTKPNFQIRNKDTRTGKIYKSVRFATLSMPCLNYFYDLFYYKNKKNYSFNYR
jgi:hypothetical protein